MFLNECIEGLPAPRLAGVTDADYNPADSPGWRVRPVSPKVILTADASGSETSGELITRAQDWQPMPVFFERPIH